MKPNKKDEGIDDYSMAKEMVQHISTQNQGEKN